MGETLNHVGITKRCLPQRVSVLAPGKIQPRRARGAEGPRCPAADSSAGARRDGEEKGRSRRGRDYMYTYIYIYRERER